MAVIGPTYPGAGVDQGEAGKRVKRLKRGFCCSSRKKSPSAGSVHPFYGWGATLRRTWQVGLAFLSRYALYMSLLAPPGKVKSSDRLLEPQVICGVANHSCAGVESAGLFGGKVGLERRLDPPRTHDPRQRQAHWLKVAESGGRRDR